MLKGVIFDMDGVLVDNLRVHMVAFGEFARRRGVAFDVARAMELNGRGNAEFMAAFLPAEVLEREGVRNLTAEKEALYREMYAPDMVPARGLIEFLENMRAHGVKMAVGTSAITPNLDFVLDGLGIRHFFEAFATADMVTRCKPDPEVYLRALEGLGLSGDECVVFEDAPAGIAAAHGAGIRSVGITTSSPASELAALPGVVLTSHDFVGIDFERLDSLLK